MTFQASRFHDFSAGHRVVGHEGKCAHLHGHNYRAHFICEPVAGLDEVGRVLDFSVIKDRLCAWLEEYWDHRFLVWVQDPMVVDLMRLDPQGVIHVPFNPTAEAMAEYLVNEVAPALLHGTNARLVACHIEETRKCSATYSLRR